MRVDHRIKIKILEGIENDLIVGIQIKESGSANGVPGRGKLKILTLGASITQRMSIFFKGGERSSTLQVPEPSQKRGSSFQKRLSVFRAGTPAPKSNSTGSEPENPGFFKRGSIFGKKGSILESNPNNRQSISDNNGQNIGSRNIYLNPAGNSQIKKESLGKELEFILNDSFHSVFLYISKKKFGGNQLLADFEIPMICFDPDDVWHEQVLALKDETYTDKQGHQFLVYSIQQPVPCYHCNRIMYSDANLPELEFFKCDCCGILCHEKCHASILSTCSKVITLKIAYSYVKETLLEPSKYRPLCDGFFNIENGLLNMYSRVCENLDDASFHILKVLETFSRRKAIDVIVSLCITEMNLADNYHNILQDPSLAIKLLELYMKTIAGDFLVFALEKSITHIIHEDSDCELDSSKHTKVKTIHISEKLGNLENYLEQIFRAITTSPKSCPFALRCIISKLYEYATKLFAGEPTAGYVVSSGILFRKFFIPAILAPDNFGIHVSSQSLNAKRTLITVSKILHKISNLDFFDSNTDINFQKLNRLIGSYHPIISIYIDELRKVSMASLGEEALPVEEKEGENIKKQLKIPWYQKLFPFCSPAKNLAKSESDLDMFKRKNEQILDWENLETTEEKTQDVDIHIAALGRSLLNHGDKLIFACQNEKETKLAYSALEWASALRGNRQQAEDLRRMAIMRLQQEYLSQFYQEDGDDFNEESEGSSENSQEPHSFVKDDVDKKLQLDLILESNESDDSIYSDGKRMSSRFYNSRKSSYEVKDKSSLSNSIQNQSVLKSFISSIHSGSSELRAQEIDGQKINQEIDENLETPIIGDVITVGEHQNSMPNLNSSEGKSLEVLTEEKDDEENESKEEVYINDARLNITMQKRKSLAMNLDSILRPQSDRAELIDSELPAISINTKQADFKKLLPQFESKLKFKTGSETMKEIPASEPRIKPTMKRDETGSFVIQKKSG